MKAVFLACLTTLLLASTIPGQGQTPAPTNNDQDSNPAFWQAKFNNGGHYLVKLGNISSASRHEYIANGTARVVEITVAASGAVVARFYWLEAIGKSSAIAPVQTATSQLQSLAQSTAGKLGSDAAKIQVIKDYPNTTHAHTVEYTLQTEDALKSLFQSLVRAIESGRGRTWLESGK